MRHERLALNGTAIVGFGADCPAQPDPRELPSSRSAIDLIDGQPGALLRVGGHTLARAALIGAGLYIIGADRNPHLVTRAFGASVAIELFAIGWVLTKRAAK